VFHTIELELFLGEFEAEDRLDAENQAFKELAKYSASDHAVVADEIIINEVSD
jgi:hypothetical protein